MPRRPRWRLLLVSPRDGAENMARDMALQEHSRKTGECVLSIYSWLRPTISFGRNQAAKGLYDMGRLAAEKIDVVRRPTGGRAILHDHEITYSVTGSTSFTPTLAIAYHRINQLLLHALRSLGAPVEIAGPRSTAPKPDASPCFAEPVKGELTAHGRKLVGSAQYRENGAFLQHGSILVANDQARLHRLTIDRDDSDAGPAPATLTEILGRSISPEILAEPLFAAVRAIEDPLAEPLDESEILEATSRLRPQFTDPLWTWRR